MKILLICSLLILIPLVLWYECSQFDCLRVERIYKPLVSYKNEPSQVFVKTYPYATLENLWIAYKDKIQKDGRTIDRSRNYLTTSEGQSYSLLRAVWMDDKDIFDRVLKWTNHNLRKRPSDKLFAWKWGQHPDGRWDVMTDEGGINTATDADVDIALALIFAHRRWNQDHYLKQAKETLRDIWETEVVTINNQPYLVAGNWAKSEAKPTINPSYYPFAAFDIFAEVDPERNWLQLKNTSYEMLFKSSANPLDETVSAGLPPDWASINRLTGEPEAPSHEDKKTHFSDDAFRTIWRVGLDWKWNKDERAKDYLESLNFLKNEWLENGAIYKSYSHSGETVSWEESPSTYAGILPYFEIVEPSLAQEIYENKLASLYNPDTEDFSHDIGYYAQNWVWFGMAFYEDRLPNLYYRKEPSL